MERYEFLDYAKIIGIWLVVLGHYTYAQNVPFEDNCVWHMMFIVTLFHMPLFFIISGMLYKPVNLKKTIKKGWTQLIIPYIIMATIGLFIEFCVNHFDLSVLLKGFFGIVSGNDMDKYGTLSYTRPIWFLYSLFMVKLMMILTQKASWIGGALCVIGVLFLYFGNKLWFRIDSSLIGFCFFYIGYLIKNWWLKLKNASINWLLCAICINILILLVVAHNNINYTIPQGAMSINKCRGGNYPIFFIISGFSGTYLVLSICSLISRLIKISNGNLIRFLSNGTIVILGFHMLVYMFLIKPYWGVFNDTLLVVVISFINLVICLLILLFCNRYIPQILGGRR